MNDVKILFAAIFFLLGVILAFITLLLHLLHLDPRTTTRATGQLVGFREYRAGAHPGIDNYRDHDENKRGLLPVFLIAVRGVRAPISCDHANPALSSADIGHTFPLLYQQKLGIVLMQNEPDILRGYLRRKNIESAVTLGLGIALIVAGIIIVLV